MNIRDVTLRVQPSAQQQCFAHYAVFGPRVIAMFLCLSERFSLNAAGCLVSLPFVRWQSWQSCCAVLCAVRTSFIHIVAPHYRPSFNITSMLLSY